MPVRRATVDIPVYLPSFLYKPLRRLRAQRRVDNGPTWLSATLAGDRDVEWSWVAAHVPDGPGRALEFGPGGSAIALIVAERGFDVTAVDLGVAYWHFEHPRVQFVQGDLLELGLPVSSFDLVLNCSTVEHVGLAGRYGVTENRGDGDLLAMNRLRELLRPGGLMLLTIPVGRDAVAAPLHRVYGERRLPRLLSGFVVEQEEFWVKGAGDLWQVSHRSTAVEFDSPDPRTLYALGCFALRKAAE